ncbi:MAG: hypothetical protein KDA91_04715 [Planctomycetaceae bacterium]|nr:hypothetical protein [Planctomycetaceae bacterium]
MKRIFLTLAILGNICLWTAVLFGLSIRAGITLPATDPQFQLDPAYNARISTHMLIGLGALTFATLVHAILFTYFMGTGRWIEETSNAYGLDAAWYNSNQKVKYGVLPGIVVVLLLLIATGAFGAVADPATPVSLGKSDAAIHFFVAVSTALANLLVNGLEFIAVLKNASIIEDVLRQVRRIRDERGLPVE